MTEQLLSPNVYAYENDQSYYTQGSSNTGLAVVGPTEKGKAFVPTDVTSYSQFSAIYGTDSKTSYTAQTVYNYLQAGSTVKVVRVLGNGGWQFNGVSKLAAIVSGSTILSVLHPTQNASSNASFSGSNVITATGTYAAFKLSISGSPFLTENYVSSSVNPTSDTYLTKVFGSSVNTQTGSIFPYLMFGNSATASVNYLTASISGNIVYTTSACTFTSSNAGGYSQASTPWVLSDSGIRLFKFHHRSDGTKTNRDVKIAIANITKGVDSNQYSTFDVYVRQWDDTDRYPSVIEQYLGVTLNPDSANFIGRAIGDKYAEYSDSQQKVVEYGDYANISNYIRVEMTDAVNNGSTHPQLIPNGYEAVYETIAGFGGSYKLPAVVNLNSNTSSISYSGFDYSNPDNLNYLNPVPSEAVVGNNANYTKPVNDNKFIIPFQGGTDGMNPIIIKKIGAEISADGTNLFGFDLSSNTSAGYATYKKALDVLSNAEEYIFDLLVLPGVLDQYHGAVTAYAQSLVEERTDAVYLRDLASMNASVSTALATVSGLDTSYSAVYYPWVKVKDLTSSRDIYVPTSVAVPEAYAYNDSIAAEWFAPAGMSRGGLGVIDTRVRLSKKERDLLYSARINPIVKFPNSGPVIWGQKTLQVKDTALNRINVRRLLIKLRTYISDIAKNFVFENNTVETRNKLINKINPYMESVQSRQGLYAFRVQIDEVLNTNDVIDRYQLQGKIFVSPAKSIEFILLEFNIQPTGATFQ
jgi:hypothetical protein